MVAPSPHSLGLPFGVWGGYKEGMSFGSPLHSSIFTCRIAPHPCGTPPCRGGRKKGGGLPRPPLTFSSLQVRKCAADAACTADGTADAVGFTIPGRDCLLAALISVGVPRPTAIREIASALAAEGTDTPTGATLFRVLAATKLLRDPVRAVVLGGVALPVDNVGDVDLYVRAAPDAAHCGHVSVVLDGPPPCRHGRYIHIKGAVSRVIRSTPLAGKGSEKSGGGGRGGGRAKRVLGTSSPSSVNPGLAGIEVGAREKKGTDGASAGRVPLPRVDSLPPSPPHPPPELGQHVLHVLHAAVLVRHRLPHPLVSVR